MATGLIQPENHRVVGIFSSPKALYGVVHDLELKGFDHAQFGVLSTKADNDSRPASEMADDPLTPTEAPDDPEESAGTIAAAIVGGLGLALLAMAAAGGVGGVSGLLIAAGFQREHAESIDSQLSKGGLVLWIQPRDAGQHSLALEAMRAAGATDVKDVA